MVFGCVRCRRPQQEWVLRRLKCKFTFFFVRECGVAFKGGGIMQGRISVSQILCKIFVRNLFGVFKDLQGYTLRCALAHLYHAKDLVNDN